MADDIAAHSRVGLGMPRSRADDDLCRLLGNQFLYRNLVISIDSNSGAGENEVLVNVPGERIVVVNEDEVGSCWDGRRRVRLVR